jgi:hypothetical protein
LPSFTYSIGHLRVGVVATLKAADVSAETYGVATTASGGQELHDAGDSDEACDSDDAGDSAGCAARPDLEEALLEHERSGGVEALGKTRVVPPSMRASFLSETRAVASPDVAPGASCTPTT